MIGQIHRFHVGQFECTAICDNNEEGDMEMAKHLFHTVPAAELEEAVRHSQSPILLSINILHIQTPERQLLVDTSVGGDSSQLMISLRQAGIEPDAIDRIIITHGHGDHIGGIINADGGFNFPSARYSVWKSEWEYWIDQAEQSHDPQDAARRNLLPIRERVDLIDHEAEIVPGVCVLPAPGHTLGHIALLITSDGEGLLHIVDAAHHPIQVTHTDWSPAFDMQPDVSAQTRRLLFERAAWEKLLVMAYHFPFPGLGRVAEQDGMLRWEAVTGI